VTVAVAQKRGEKPRNGVGSLTEFALDTFPKLLLARAEGDGDRYAMREKALGIWQSWTWREVREEICILACGLAAKGFQRGDKLAVVGDNRPRLYWSMCAAQCLGGIPVPMYQDSVADEIQYVIEHAEVRFAVAEDQEQVDKLLEIKLRCPKLEVVIYDNPRGMRHYAYDFLHHYEAVLDAGRDFDQQNTSFFMDEMNKGKGEDVGIILYTSGTTGNPKGVVLSYDNVLSQARNGIAREGLGQDEKVLAYLPMAWVGDHVFSYAQSYVAGFCVSCPESGATVMTDLREIAPTYFFAPPRIYENLLTTVTVRMEDAGWLKRKMFHYFMDLARRAGTRILDAKPVPAKERVLYAMGRVLVYGPLKNTLGFSHIRVAYTAGEAIGPDIFEFYRALGMNIKQLYGQTECAIFVTIQPDGQVKPDTVGTPAPQVEVKITKDGEVLYRSPGVFQEYYKNPAATAETKTADGWVHTGDAGYFNEDGQLKIIDRAKDVGKLNDGSLFAPKFLENKLKFFPHIKEAVTFGDGRDYVAALLSIDMEAVGDWAERRNIPYASYQELAAKPQIYDLLQQGVEQVNRDLSSDAQLASSQIQRYLILHKELDADDGELTRTRKVRRRFIAEKYGKLIDALYSDASHCEMEVQVTFEDGSKGSITGDLQIRNLAPVASLAKVPAEPTP
jgi:long-chain acyl-CoA synthetase